jgi:hypothetical protein
VTIERHVYQSSSGGKLIIPMERSAHIVGTTITPRFAKMVSWKYGQLSALRVSEDLTMNHGRKTSRKLIQSIGELVGSIALENEFEWTYELPKMEAVVTHIAIGRDGTTTPILNEGYRETMCSTFTFYSKDDRMHSIYSACAPEHGKSTFNSVMDNEIEKIKALYPNVVYIGLADGAKDNWTYLEQHTTVQMGAAPV